MIPALASSPRFGHKDFPGESSGRVPLYGVVAVEGARVFYSSICVPIPCSRSVSSDTPDNAGNYNLGSQIASCDRETPRECATPVSGRHVVRRESI